MSKAAFDKISDGLKEAIAVARGEKEPAKIAQYASDRVFDGKRKIVAGKADRLRRNYRQKNA